ncbi:MAG: transposase [Acidobacteria bacterium]|nr:transposase [Acidobacteriota bacterium]
MPFDPKKHRRRSIRLGGYDYSQIGEYFVTLCTHKMRCLFGEVKNGKMHLNRLGQIVESEWRKTPHLRPGVDLGDFVVMPNHLHGLLVIKQAAEKRILATSVSFRAHVCAPLRRHPRGLGGIIAGFKSATTTQTNQQRRTPGSPVWQRNYHEHIIQDEEDSARTSHYISINPMLWRLDRYNNSK